MAKVRHVHNLLDIKKFIGMKIKMKNFDEPLEVIDVKREIPPFKGARNQSVIYLKFRYSNKFETIEVWHRYDNVKKGQVRNYLKLGKYDTYFGKPLENNIKGSTSLNNIWLDMHCRCNTNDYKYRNYYGKVKVVEEWRVYQNFIKWVRSDESNYDTRWVQEIYKDLFQWFKQSDEIKYYGPNTCVFLPKSLNRFLSSFTFKKKYGVDNNTPYYSLIFNGKSIHLHISELGNNPDNFKYCKHYIFNAMMNYYFNTYQINNRIYEQLKKINNFEYLITDNKDIMKYIPINTINKINEVIDNEVHKMRIRDKIIENKDEVSPETRVLWSVF